MNARQRSQQKPNPADLPTLRLITRSGLLRAGKCKFERSGHKKGGFMISILGMVLKPLLHNIHPFSFVISPRLSWDSVYGAYWPSEFVSGYDPLFLLNHLG
jgi:hypothetical protein